ncbi:hypothetical protein Tco_0053375 [Tanacetum coccineum]
MSKLYASLTGLLPLEFIKQTDLKGEATNVMSANNLSSIESNGCMATFNALMRGDPLPLDLSSMGKVKYRSTAKASEDTIVWAQLYMM